MTTERSKTWSDVEKVLFASVNINALGVVLEPDAAGNAAVVRSMMTPLQVEVANNTGAYSESQTLEVGDVLIAINGKLVNNISHFGVLNSLNVDCFSGEKGGEMLALSFMDPSAYYSHLRAGTLKSHVLQNPNIFGRQDERRGWRDYLPSFSFSPFGGSSQDHSSSGGSVSQNESRPKSLNTTSSSHRSYLSSSSSTGEQGEAYLKLTSGQYRQALAVYTTVLEREPLNHTVRISRSMCYLRLGEYESALRDALTCCALKPEWPVPYVCQGAALDAMHSPVDACSAYLCGLIVDPRNAVLRKHLNALFERMGWTCMSLDGRNVVGTVASAVLQREEYGADMIVDRIILFRDPACCNAHLREMEPLLRVVNGGCHGAVSIRVTDSARYRAGLGKEIESCELFNEDEILTANGVAVKSLDQLWNLIESSTGVVVIGTLSAARIAANKLLEEEYTKKAETALGSKRGSSLFVVEVEGCGDGDANGTYIPQELHYGTFVFENSSGYLLSIEKTRTADGWESGWVLGKDGKILYAGMLYEKRVVKEIEHAAGLNRNSASNTFGVHTKPLDASKYFLHCDNLEFMDNMSSVRWHSVYGKPALPLIRNTQRVPSLGYFIGSEQSGGAGEASITESELENWTADLQILAIKGYGNRSLSRNEFETALLCFQVVEEQASALLDDTDTDTEEDGEESMPAPITARTMDDDLSVGANSPWADLDGGMTSCVESSEGEHKEECEQSLRYLIVRVQIAKAQTLLELGKPQEALRAAETVNGSCRSHNIGPFPLALYWKAMAEAALGMEVVALNSCREGKSMFTAPAQQTTTLFRKLVGLEEELVRQGQELTRSQNLGELQANLAVDVKKSSEKNHSLRSPVNLLRKKQDTSEPKQNKTKKVAEGVESIPVDMEANAVDSSTQLQEGKARMGSSSSSTTTARGSEPGSSFSFVVSDIKALSDKCLQAPRSSFTREMRDLLRKGVRCVREGSSSRSQTLKSKPKFLRCSVDCSQLQISTTSKFKTDFFRRGMLSISRKNFVGVILGRVLPGEENGSSGDFSLQPDSLCLTLVFTNASTMAFRMENERERNQIAQSLASWRATGNVDDNQA